MLLVILRDERFSPNSVDNDRLIIQRSAELTGMPFTMVSERDFHWPLEEATTQRHVHVAPPYWRWAGGGAVYILSMARSAEALHELQKAEEDGVTVINSPEAVSRCERLRLTRLMRLNDIPMPAEHGPNGVWLKRGNGSAESKDDVVFCANSDEEQRTIEKFKARGIKEEEIVRQAHIEGDLVKWYAVSGGFFRYYYPTDDGISKFGDEERNGKALHTPFDVESLKREVFRLASIVGIKVFGGDAIIDSQGRFYIIDFNDWPSFARCREEAAKAISDGL